MDSNRHRHIHTNTDTVAMPQCEGLCIILDLKSKFVGLSMRGIFFLQISSFVFLSVISLLTLSLPKILSLPKRGTVSFLREIILIERTPPPPGGFPIYYVPYQEPCVRGPPSKHLVQILRGGSCCTRFLMREHSK